MGVVWVECPEPPPTDVMVRMTYTFAGSTRVGAQPAAVEDNSALILVVPKPQEQPRPGPVLLAIDLCVPDGNRPVSVSNTVVNLLNVSRG